MKTPSNKRRAKQVSLDVRSPRRQPEKAILGIVCAKWPAEKRGPMAVMMGRGEGFIIPTPIREMISEIAHRDDLRFEEAFVQSMVGYARERCAMHQCGADTLSELLDDFAHLEP
jgi:hypothetical protein